MRSGELPEAADRFSRFALGTVSKAKDAVKMAEQESTTVVGEEIDGAGCGSELFNVIRQGGVESVLVPWCHPTVRQLPTLLSPAIPLLPGGPIAGLHRPETLTPWQPGCHSLALGRASIRK